jgi:glutamine synthetase
MLNDGIFFDGSSIAGWKAINESDMILKPDLTSSFIDPFFSHTTLSLFCDVMDPISKTFYERDPRSTALLLIFLIIFFLNLGGFFYKPMSG